MVCTTKHELENQDLYSLKSEVLFGNFGLWGLGHKEMNDLFRQPQRKPSAKKKTPDRKKMRKVEKTYTQHKAT